MKKVAKLSDPVLGLVLLVVGLAIAIPVGVYFGYHPEVEAKAKVARDIVIAAIGVILFVTIVRGFLADRLIR